MKVALNEKQKKTEQEPLGKDGLGPILIFRLPKTEFWGTQIITF